MRYTEIIKEDVDAVPANHMQMMDTPPAYVQQVEEPANQEPPLYTLDPPAEEEPEADNDPVVGQITQYFDSSKVRDADSSGYIIHDETPAGTITYVNGSVDEYTADIFMDEFYNPVDIQLMVLNSPGGRVDYIYEIAEQIRSRGIPVLVPSGAKCMSACLLMFAAGTERGVASDANFMIHHVRIGRTNPTLDYDASMRFFDTIERYLGDEGFYDVYREQMPEDLTWDTDALYVPGSYMVEHGYANTFTPTAPPQSQTPSG